LLEVTTAFGMSLTGLAEPPDDALAASNPESSFRKPPGAASGSGHRRLRLVFMCDRRRRLSHRSSDQATRPRPLAANRKKVYLRHRLSSADDILQPDHLWTSAVSLEVGIISVGIRARPGWKRIRPGSRVQYLGVLEFLVQRGVSPVAFFPTVILMSRSRDGLGPSRSSRG